MSAVRNGGLAHASQQRRRTSHEAAIRRGPSAAVAADSAEQRSDTTELAPWHACTGSYSALVARGGLSSAYGSAARAAHSLEPAPQERARTRSSGPECTRDTATLPESDSTRGT